jgi:hypothetical protein
MWRALYVVNIHKFTNMSQKGEHVCSIAQYHTHFGAFFLRLFVEVRQKSHHRTRESLLESCNNHLSGTENSLLTSCNHTITLENMVSIESVPCISYIYWKSLLMH